MDDNTEELIDKYEVLLKAKDENIDLLEKIITVQEKQIEVLHDMFSMFEGDNNTI